MSSFAVDESRRRPLTFYVDFARLESTAAGTGAVGAYQTAEHRPDTVPTRVTTVDDEVNGLRLNVKDAARAVLSWLASVTQHEGNGSLDRVLDKCLRPRADASAVNYAALSNEINRTLGMDLSAKRVQTAVRHLRNAAAKGREQASGTQTVKTPTMADRFDALHARLQANHEKLLSGQGRTSNTLRRAVAHDVLGVLRASAGRLIECGFGEGIPEHVDLDATRQRFLIFVQRALGCGLGTDEPCDIRDDLARLLSALHDHDGSTEADMQLVVTGANVVADLAGPDSLPGLMAKLNVLMVGRPMLESDFFVSQMLTLAEAAGNLINDKSTRAYMAWARHQPKDRLTPSPNRVRSYCLNNAATHILERLHTGELTGGRWFVNAQHCFDTMKKHDRGFKLLKTTEAIMLSVLADLTGNTAPARDFFTRLGRDKSLGLLADLRQFDNSDALNRLVRRGATAVHPTLAGQLLVLPR